MAQTFDVIQRLIQSGQMPELIRAGIVSPTMLEYYQIAQEFKALQKKYRHSPLERIVKMVADNRKICIGKVYIARSKMR